MTAALTHISRRWVPRSPITGYGHWKYTATVSIHDPLALCPQPTPLASIPCQDGGASVAIAGEYEPGKPTLQPLAGGGGLTTKCNATATSCAAQFVLFPENIHGLLALVWTVSAGQLIKQPGNDLGRAGAEFPLSIYVKYVAPTG